MSYRYFAYGLKIDSVLELPELGSYFDTEGEADLTIRLGAVAHYGAEDGGRRDDIRWIDPQHFWLHVNEVGHYLVRDGREITVMPDADADPSAVRVFLLGSACGALLVQRGFLVLHGNAIRVGDGCLICVGDSGSGKSTLAAGFLRRGYQVLADDVVAIDADGCAIPGFPRIKLWQDAAEQLGFSTEGLVRVLPEMDKFNLPVAVFNPQLRLPIRWIYHLTSDESRSIRIDPVSGLRRFKLLWDNTYRNEYLEGEYMYNIHLDQCGNLASQVHISKVTRPKNEFLLDDLIDNLIRDAEYFN